MDLDRRLQKYLSPDIYCLVHNKIVNLEQQVHKQKEVIDKVILELANIDGSLSNSQLSDRICNLIDILEEENLNEKI